MIPSLGEAVRAAKGGPYLTILLILLLLLKQCDFQILTPMSISIDSGTKFSNTKSVANHQTVRMPRETTTQTVVKQPVTTPAMKRVYPKGRVKCCSMALSFGFDHASDVPQFLVFSLLRPLALDGTLPVSLVSLMCGFGAVFKKVPPPPA